MANVVQPRVSDVIAKSLLTTKGDIIQFSGTVPERLGIGLDYQIPRRDAATDKLAYVYEGTRLKESEIVTKNAAKITILAGTAAYDLISLNLGTVKNGDRINIIINGYCTSCTGSDILKLYKTAGTATCVFGNDASLSYVQISCNTDSKGAINTFTKLLVTGDGTLTLSLNAIGAAFAFGFEFAAGALQIFSEFTYKQN